MGFDEGEAALELVEQAAQRLDTEGADAQAQLFDRLQWPGVIAELLDLALEPLQVSRRGLGLQASAVRLTNGEESGRPPRRLSRRARNRSSGATRSLKSTAAGSAAARTVRNVVPRPRPRSLSQHSATLESRVLGIIRERSQAALTPVK